MFGMSQNIWDVHRMLRTCVCYDDMYAIGMQIHVYPTCFVILTHLKLQLLQSSKFNSSSFLATCSYSSSSESVRIGSCCEDEQNYRRCMPALVHSTQRHDTALSAKHVFVRNVISMHLQNRLDFAAKSQLYYRCTMVQLCGKTQISRSL